MQQPPIGQPGERVVFSTMLQLGFIVTSLGNVILADDINVRFRRIRCSRTRCTLRGTLRGLLFCENDAAKCLPGGAHGSRRATHGWPAGLFQHRPRVEYQCPDVGVTSDQRLREPLKFLAGNVFAGDKQQVDGVEGVDGVAGALGNRADARVGHLLEIKTFRLAFELPDAGCQYEGTISPDSMTIADAGNSDRERRVPRKILRGIRRRQGPGNVRAYCAPAKRSARTLRPPPAPLLRCCP